MHLCIDSLANIRPADRGIIMKTLRRYAFLLSTFLSTLLLVVGPSAAVAEELTPHQVLAKSIFQELIEINTTHSVGDNTRAAQAMADRLLANPVIESYRVEVE